MTAKQPAPSDHVRTMTPHSLMQKIAHMSGWIEIEYNSYHDDGTWRMRYTGTTHDGNWQNLPDWINDEGHAITLCITVLDLLNQYVDGYWTIEIGAENIYLHQHINSEINADRWIVGRGAVSFARLACWGLEMVKEVRHDS